MLFAGVTILVIGHQLWLWARGWRFNALSPYFMCDLMIFALFGLGSLGHPVPARTVAEETLFCIYVWSGVIAYYVGLHLKLRLPSVRLPRLALPLTWVRSRLELVSIGLAAGFTVAVAFALYQRTRVLGMSISELASLSALQAYTQAFIQGTGELLTLVAYLVLTMMLMHLYFLMQQKRYLLALGMYVIINLLLPLIVAVRIPIVVNLALPLAYYHYAIKRINVILIVLILIGGPLLLTALHGWRGKAKSLFEWSVPEILVAEAGVLQSLYLVWQTYLEEKLQIEYGAQYYYYSLVSLVPRALWAEKPLTSFEARWTANLYGDVLRYGQIWVHTFTPWGEGLVQFGWIGSLINLFLYGLVLNMGIQFFQRRPHACLVYFAYTIAAATFMRTGTNALLFATVPYVVMVWLYERWLMPKQFREVKECASS